MSFNWSDFLVTAENLSRQTIEADHRASISRSYYAAYHFAKIKMESQFSYNEKNKPKEFRGGLHQYLLSEMKKSTVRWIKEANTLSTLRDYRTDADYRVSFEKKNLCGITTQELSKHAYRTAKSFITDVKYFK